MNGVQTRLKCKPNVKQCKRLVFPARSALFNHNILNTKAISHFQANHILIRFVFPPLKKQLAKPQTWFCKYFPKRIRNVGEKEISDRQMVYDFKDGRSFEAVAQMTAANMQEQYGESCKNIVFVQVPASTSSKNELRYKAFCERVCELTGAINGYEHVRVIGGRLAIHENRKMEKEIRKVHIIDFDEDWFSGKSVVTFDDVITRGITWATYADQLENLGAHVIGGIFLAKTHYKVSRQ